MSRHEAKNRAYRRVEQPPRDPEERPDVDHEREPKAQRRVDQGVEIRRRDPVRIRLGPQPLGRPGRVGNLRSGEGKEQEQERPDKLTRHGREGIARSIRDLQRRQLIRAHGRPAVELARASLVVIVVAVAVPVVIGRLALLACRDPAHGPDGVKGVGWALHGGG